MTMTKRATLQFTQILNWTIGILLVFGWLQLIGVFSVKGLDPVVLFGVSAFLTGYISLRDFRSMGLGNIKSFIASSALGILILEVVTLLSKATEYIPKLF